LLGAVVIDEGFTSGGGSNERSDGGVVGRTRQTQVSSAVAIPHSFLWISAGRRKSGEVRWTGFNASACGVGVDQFGAVRHALVPPGHSGLGERPNSVHRSGTRFGGATENEVERLITDASFGAQTMDECHARGPASQARDVSFQV
jgi:hypothetical protein